MSDFNTTSPELAYNITDFLACNAGTNYICYHNFSILDQKIIDDDTFQFVASNILDDYMEELKDISVQVHMTPREQTKYFYNPDLLSYDLYETVELGFVILKLNGIIDPKEFDMEIVRLVSKANLATFLSTIYSAEQSYITINREYEEIVTE
jgi:hypothetical protein